MADTRATAIASPRAWHIGIHGNAAYEQAVGAAAYVKPFADVHLVYLRSGSYAERGTSPFNLAVLSRGQVAPGGASGIEAGGRIAMAGDKVLRPFASAAIAFLGNDWGAVARYAALPVSAATFRLDTVTPATLGKFIIGAELLGKTVDFRIEYMPEVGKRYLTHAGMMRLSYWF